MGYNPPLIFGPVAPENNPPIMPQFFQPRSYQISAITFGVNTVITTVVNHDYVVGQSVRLTIPQPNGAYQLNETQSYVISIPAANQVLLNLDSTVVNPFIPSTSSDQFIPQIMAIGDVNSGPINTGRRNNPTFIDGSFINVSP